MTDTTITKTVFLKATPETVWAFLTEKDKLATWFHAAENDLAEGHEYALVEPDNEGNPQPQCWGTVVKMDPPNSLQYTFTIKPMGGEMTTVFWTLEKVEGGTKLTMVHEGIAEAIGLLFALDAGWDNHFAKLRTATNA